MSGFALAALLLSAMAGAIIQTTTGFGFGILCMAVFPYLLPNVTQAAAVSSLCAATMATFVVVQFRRHCRLRVIAPSLVGYALTSTLCIRFAAQQAQGALMKALGAVLILISIYFIFWGNRFRIRPIAINGFVAGAVGGVGAGFFSIGGPPMVIYLLSSLQDKEEYRATSQLYFAIGSWYASTVRGINGILTPQVLQCWLLAVVALAVGVAIGNRVFARIDAALLRKLVYGFMAISGLKMLLS